MAKASPTGLRSAEAYNTLRKMILEDAFPPGSVLAEAELVRLLQMSRTPVREALGRLQAERYIWAIPGRGYAITELSIEDLHNVYTVRAALEGLAAELAATRATRADLGRLEDLYEAMEGARSRNSDDELAELNSRFHDAIAQASGNSYLQGMLSQIREVFERFRKTALALPGRREKAHLEHGELIAALRDRDQERARDLASIHARRALDARSQGNEHDSTGGTR